MNNSPYGARRSTQISSGCCPGACACLSLCGGAEEVKDCHTDRDTVFYLLEDDRLLRIIGHVGGELYAAINRTGVHHQDGLVGFG